MSTEPSYSLIETVPKDAEILAVLGDKEDAIAILATTEKSPRPFSFRYKGKDQLIVIEGETALALAIQVGDRWFKTEDLDRLDEETVSLIVGVLVTMRATEGFAFPGKENC